MKMNRAWKRGDRVQPKAGVFAGTHGTVKSLSHSDIRGTRLWVVFDQSHRSGASGANFQASQLKAVKEKPHPTEIELLRKRLLGDKHA